MSKKHKRLRLPPVVTLRTVTVDFTFHTVSFDGRVIKVDAPIVTFPILSGDAVFIAKGDVERVA